MTTIQWKPAVNAITTPKFCRIQAVPRSTDGGREVAVTAEGARTLPGFSGSAVQSLTVAVENLPDMISLIRDSYSGRLVDILDIRTA